MQVIRRLDFGIGGIDGANDNVFGFLVPGKHHRVFIDNNGLLGGFLFFISRIGAGRIGIGSRVVAGGKGEGTEQRKQEC